MSNYRLFTLQEALALLPTVRQIVIEIQDAKSTLDTASAQVERLLGLTGGNGHLAEDVARARDEAQVAATRLESLMAELDSLGVQLRGIEQGLVDFPTEREGRVVLLCYQLGEETIAWWHDEDTGFPGRQPL
jgi:hypothetical protein